MAPRATPLGRLGGLGKAPHQLLQGALNTLEPLLDCRAQRHSGAVVKDGELQDTSPPPSEAVSCLPYKSQRTKPPPPSPWCCSQLNDLNSLTSMSNSGNWQIQGPAVEERTPTSPRKAGFNSSLTGAWHHFICPVIVGSSIKWKSYYCLCHVHHRVFLTPKWKDDVL